SAATTVHAAGDELAVLRRFDAVARGGVGQREFQAERRQFAGGKACELRLDGELVANAHAVAIARQRYNGVGAPLARPQLAVAQQEPVGVLAAAEPIAAATQTQADVPAAEFRLLARITDQSRDAIGIARKLAFAASAGNRQGHRRRDDGKNYRHDEYLDQT